MSEITGVSRQVRSRPGMLADEFYLSGLDDMTGEQRLQPHALAVGLAAAVLGELALLGLLAIDDGRLLVRESPSKDELQERVRQWVLRDRSVVVAKDWIQVLVARDVATLVIHRMHSANKVVRVTRKRLLRKPLELYLPESLSSAAASGVRIAGHLSEPRDLSPGDLMLAGLLRVTGRDREVFSHCDPTVHTELGEQLRRNLGHTGAQLLLHTSEVLVDQALTPQF
ncbi:GPP34 family phosphoprotein [Actinokineospora enzanensis]|uniref:GPP34 family phosphoprotein n=1 Tax=Actinokineospora enzanensis TaxID=155975 RepID=UPI00146D528C|nr:GPP34 family phosphoprotein [Actinokineospora enzanensis]